MERRWAAKAAIVSVIITACRSLVAQRQLVVSYRRQPGHAAADFDEYAYYNRLADRLATARGTVPRRRR